MIRNNQPVRNGANKWDPPLGNLPFLLIVAICPLVMFFMMRGMHSGSPDHSDRQSQDSGRAEGSGQERPGHHHT